MRICGWAIAIVLLFDLMLMPWTGHLFDSAVFFRIADYVFFAHTPLTSNWSFGSLGLLAVLLSQLPVLFNPALSAVYPLRLFLLKVPSWICDVGTAAVIRASCTDPAWGNCWALRYLLDPAVLFTTVFHGQWDAIPNLFAVAGIALMASGRYEYSAVALGLGTGTKFYPAAFVPLLLVTAYRAGSLRRALVGLGWFALTSAATLFPVLWGRLDYVVHSYAFNSFGTGQGVFTFSAWSLLPKSIGVSTRAEQFVAVLIPLGLAAAELRHIPQRHDVARAAMLSAISIVVLNPGAHPPFYLWVAGPLVLYAAIAEDGFVSSFGVVMSAAAVLTQFCLEGSDEYFLLTFGTGPSARVMKCFAPMAAYQWVILGSALLIAVGSYSREEYRIPWERWRRIGQSFAIVAAVVFFSDVWTAVASAAHRPHRAIFREAALFDALPIGPIVQRNGANCRLTYNSYGSVSYAENRFAERFVKATLGYELFSPEIMVVRGKPVDVASLPSHYENRDVAVYDAGTMRITREFDVTPLLKPIYGYETMIERPCSLISNNPLLIYHFNLDAARVEAQQESLLRRLNVFSQETPNADR